MSPADEQLLLMVNDRPASVDVLKKAQSRGFQLEEANAPADASRMFDAVAMYCDSTPHAPDDQKYATSLLASYSAMRQKTPNARFHKRTALICKRMGKREEAGRFFERTATVSPHF